MEKARPSLPSKNERCVALLGRRDEPTDAVEEYCRYLKDALVPHGFSLELVRVPWFERGWQSALSELRRHAAEWRCAWVFAQYTALAWSRRGFPLRVPPLLRLLKSEGARCAVVFHDAGPHPGRGIAHVLRKRLQIHAMREAVRVADLAVLTIPAEKVGWLPANHRSVFIPVGANLPAPEEVWSSAGAHREGPPAVAVFTVTGDRAGLEEVACATEAVRFAAERLGKLRLVVLGRNSESAEAFFRESLRDLPVELAVHGVLPAEEVACVLGACDVMLFARGSISTRRGSAIAGIACGLPVIAREGEETASPITEAGVVLLPANAKSEFGPALLRVLTDPRYRASLAARSCRAQKEHFSWAAIAEKYAAAMRSSADKF